MKLIYKALIILISFNAHSAETTQDRYEIIYGILGKTADGEYYFRDKTTNIPLITKHEDENFKFGYIIKESSKGFEVYTKVTMPTSSTLHSNEPVTIDDDGNTTTVTSKKRFYKSQQHNMFISLDKGDRPGIYLVEIYINDKLYKVINFNVQEKQVGSDET